MPSLLSHTMLLCVLKLCDCAIGAQVHKSMGRIIFPARGVPFWWAREGSWRNLGRGAFVRGNLKFSPIMA